MMERFVPRVEGLEDRVVPSRPTGREPAKVSTVESSVAANAVLIDFASTERALSLTENGAFIVARLTVNLEGGGTYTQDFRFAKEQTADQYRDLVRTALIQDGFDAVNSGDSGLIITKRTVQVGSGGTADLAVVGASWAFVENPSKLKDSALPTVSGTQEETGGV